MFTDINFARTSARVRRQKLAAQLEADVKAGAVGLGEIMQELRPDRHARPTARG